MRHAPAPIAAQTAHALPDFPLITPEQLGRASGLSKDTILRWIVSFRIPSVGFRDGSRDRYLVPREDAIEFLNTRRANAAQETS